MVLGATGLLDEEETGAVPAATTVTDAVVSDEPESIVAEVPTTEIESSAMMPDVVGMDLQAAQDTIQEAGVFYSRSEDATGRGRMQILDRNWTVVRQDPAPGTAIGEGDALLYVVKDDEL